MNPTTAAALAFMLFAFAAAAQDKPSALAAWRHSGDLTILTTPDGANLPATAVVEDFPLLVRLDRDWFDFQQARPDGADIRFSDASGAALAHQIEEWDAARGAASIWVRVPRITGDSRQTIRLHWGNTDATNASDATAVFNASNGFLAVWHMDASVADAVGTLETKDVGTAAAPGVIGPARRLAGRQGIFAGEKIAGFPEGSAPHTSEAWFRAGKPNGRVMAWGNEQAQGKVVMNFRAPPHVQMDCYFSNGNVAGKRGVPLGEWVHVVHTYRNGDSRLYVNGVLDGVTTNLGSPLAIRSPARLWIGGWYHNYDFVGDVDEVRVSKVARSAEWVRLQFENQKPRQTLVGPLVRPGTAFGVTPARATVPEGGSATFTAEASGAQKIYWILQQDGREEVVATDRFAFTFDAGRVTRDSKATLRFKAVCADGVKTRDIALTVKEAVPEPNFSLKAPRRWDGRGTIEVVPRFSNMAAMRAKNVADLRIRWSVSPIATIKEVADGKLILKRAQNSGPMTVTATIDNGGKPATASATIVVTEPKRDEWTARVPVKDEKPEPGQFYARDDSGEGTLHYNGTHDGPGGATVFLRVFADDKPYRTERLALGPDKSYAFAVKLRPGLVKYRVEFGIVGDGSETVLHTVGDLVCGDAYVITGQSNAVATDFGKDDQEFRSEWIRTFGSMSGNPRGVRLWGEARHRSRDAEKLQIGYWGMELGRRLVEAHRVPVCFLNGAVGGTRIDQHQRNAADPTDMTTIYGRLLWRAREARLTHGIRGIIWHQGENDQGADGPTGGYGWETYRELFIELAAAWKQDFPNVRHYHVFQIWPKSCAMGIDGSDNRLREVQRSLPTAFSNMSIMSTLGIDPPGGCHFPAAGYAEFARLLFPVIERDHYGVAPASPVTPPNLRSARFASSRRDEIVLQFDQPVKWDDALATEFQIDGAPANIVSGQAVESTLTLKLAATSNGSRLTYLDSKSWSQKKLLRGRNDIAALTFYDVPLLPGKPGRQ